ncbi:polyketide synthase dehydratase-domain-containing protein [Aspergillus multicolor]|uniref:polyketide synthase dehydratase-domain-containing protein n=1 Tax=Aspergillus multicolor TaxID=41759 RepID=UPI003CCCA03D
MHHDSSNRPARPSVPVVSTLTGNVVKSEGIFNASYLVRQCRQQVDFVGALKTAQSQRLISDGSLVVELGPHPVGTNLLSLCLPDIQLVAVSSLKRGHPDWEIISKCLVTAYTHHQTVDWGRFHDDYLPSLSLVSNLPSYAFEETEYWTPYRRQKTVDALSDDRSSGTTCLQQIEFLGADKRSAVFASKIQEPSLLAAIQGHLVDDVAMCPTSLFIDMAYGAVQTVAASKGAAVELADLQMISPLAVSSDVEQAIRVDANLVEAKASSVEVQITSTIHRNSTQHAACRMQRLVQLQVSILTATPSKNSCYSLTRALFYKLFDSIVEYSAPFRLLENITIDGDAQDAVSKIRICTRDTTTHGSFSLDPFTIDALVHLPGFLLNCDLEKPKEDLHIAKSIGRVLVLDALQAEAGSSPLTCYITVTAQGEDGATFCDTCLFTKSKRPVALISGICLQKISRQIFCVIAGGAGTTARSNSSPNRLMATLSSAPEKPKTTPAADIEAEGVYSAFLRAVAAITGVDINQVKSAESFEVLGVDSHMAMSIITETNNTAGVTLPAASFSNCPTISDAERGLGGSDSGSPSPSEGILTPPSTASSKANSPNKPLFCVAESSGSVAVYLHLPPLPDGTPVYCLESPFAQCPEKYNLSIPNLARAYIASMRTVRPHGPYLTGGYFFGSVLAYETAYQLALMGERVLGLLLMDMYAPPPALQNFGTHRFLGRLPEGPMTNMNRRLMYAGLFKLTDIEMIHLEAVLEAAVPYEALSMPRGFEPIQTHIVWATKGMNYSEHADEHDEGVNGMKAFM